MEVVRLKTNLAQQRHWYQVVQAKIVESERARAAAEAHNTTMQREMEQFFDIFGELNNEEKKTEHIVQSFWERLWYEQWVQRVGNKCTRWAGHYTLTRVFYQYVTNKAMYSHFLMKNLRIAQNSIKERKIFTDVHFISWVWAKDVGQKVILWSLQSQRTFLKIKGGTNRDVQCIQWSIFF